MKKFSLVGGYVFRVFLNFFMKFDRIINAITATVFLFREVRRPIGLILAL